MESATSDGKEVTPAEGRSWVSGKTSVTRLFVEEAAAALGVEVDVLRKRTREGSVPHERDEHGHVFVLVGAYSNLPDANHSHQRKPEDKALIGDLETQAANLRTALGPVKTTEAHLGAPGVLEKPS
jgi:hypothetical protein